MLNTNDLNSLERNRELVDLLNIASAAYYNTGKPIMSDKHFDEAFKELQELEAKTGLILSNSPTQNVGAEVLPELNEVKHNHKMLSLDKCHSVEEVIKFGQKKQLIGMWKLDGMSVSIKYIDGVLASAETRGNGEIGVDITEHIKQFKNVPIHINREGTYIIDGEAIITDKDFEDVNTSGEYANSRNLVSGTLNSLDTDIVKQRKVSFIAWDVIDGDGSNLLSDRLLHAEMLGFDTTNNTSTLVNTNDSIQHMIDVLKEEATNKGMPIDGIVFKFDDIAFGKTLGATAHHFRNGIAYKFTDIGVQSKITNIEWSLGKTGQITPIAVFEPIEIEGSVVERASLHNLSILENLNIIIGDTVEVIKANQVIPQVRNNLSAQGRESQYIQYPAKCPRCGGEVAVEQNGNTRTVVCLNNNCGGKLLGKMKHFVSKNAMNIVGLSEKKLETLINEDFINDYIDIYELYNNFGVSGDVAKLNGFGKKSAQKLFDAIENSKNTTLDRFIYALSIPMVGRTASKTISDYFNGDFEKFYEALLRSRNIRNYFDWTFLDDFGKAIDDSINEFATNDNLELIIGLAEYMNFQKEDMSNKDNKLGGKTFVITGKVEKFSNRNELKEEIENHGGKVTGSVSKNTDYLINNDIKSTTGKNKKAKELGVSIITEDDYIKMIN